MKLNFNLLSILSVVFLSIAFMSCGEDTSASADDAATENVATTPENTNNNLTASTENAATTPEAPVGPTTSMELKETTYDFGKVKSGEKITHKYEFTNTGSEPLLISNVKPACGCTAPDWTKTPVQPGEKGFVQLQYSAKGKGKQKKDATITANTVPATTKIYFEAEVLPEEGK